MFMYASGFLSTVTLGFAACSFALTKEVNPPLLPGTAFFAGAAGAGGRFGAAALLAAVFGAGLRAAGLEELVLLTGLRGVAILHKLSERQNYILLAGSQLFARYLSGTSLWKRHIMSNTAVKGLIDWSVARRAALKSTVGAIIAAAAVGIFAVIVGSFGTLQAKLLYTIILFVAFTFLSLYDAQVSAKHNERFAVISVFVSVYLMLVGIIKIWFADFGLHNTLTQNGDYYGSVSTQSPFDAIYTNFIEWIGLVLIARGALLYVDMLLAIRRNYIYNSLSAIVNGTIAVVAILAALFSLPIIFHHTHFADAYYRADGVAVILVLLGTVLIPIIGRFFGERVARPVRAYPSTAGASTRLVNETPSQPTANVSNGEEVAAEDAGHLETEPAATPVLRMRWPLYEDGTPLPAGPDGLPDYSGTALQE
jgi:hypothetical protein